MTKRTSLAALFCTSALCAALPAMAQTAAPVAPAAPDQDAVSSLDEVVVTAQKRSENAQSVPISLLAFNAQALTNAGVATPGDLQRIAPTFKYTSSIGTLAARLSIRGVGTFGNSAIEPSVGVFMNGVYIPRPASIVNSLLDVSSVEVLSGPQGTLFGRNASVGALSFHSPDPTDYFSGNIKTEVATGDRIRTEGAVNIPIGDRTAVRLAALVDNFGGLWKTDGGERFGGVDTHQGRITLKSHLTDQLTWTVYGDYQSNSGDGLLNTQYVPGTLTPATIANLTTIQGGIAPRLDEYGKTNQAATDHAYLDDTIKGVTSDLSFTSANDFTVRLISGFYDWDSKQGDGDTASLAVYVLGRDLRYNSQSQSHELQLISPKGLFGGHLDFVAGLYYFDEDLGILADSLNGPAFCGVVIPRINAAAFPGLPGTDTASRVAACNTYTGPSTRGDFNQNTRSTAAYGQATYNLTSTLSLTGGVRYTDEKKSGTYVGTVFNPTGAILAANENTALDLSDSRLTYRANIAWRPAEDLMFFGTVSTGFKSGGFNNGIATAVLGQQRIFEAETVTNYELGLKSQFFDRMLTFNATGYRMDIENFQERSIVNTTSTIRNVGAVRQQGVELETVLRPMQGLKLNATVAYLDSQITSYANAPRAPYLPAISPNVQDLSGAPLSYSPKWSGVVGAEYGQDFGASGMRWLVNTDVNFVSSQQMGTTIDNSPLLREGGYSLLNARFTVYGADDQWSFSVYGRNLTGEGYCAAKVYQVLEGPLGLRYDNDGIAGNDGTAVRCVVGAPRVVGAVLSARF